MDEKIDGGTREGKQGTNEWRQRESEREREREEVKINR